MAGYHLDETERSYLEGRNQDLPESYQQRIDKVERKVERKVNLLPERFERLLQDVRLLKDQGYLDSRVGLEGWFELMNVNSDSTDEKAPDESASISSEEPALSTVAPNRFGYDLGSTMYFLAPSTYDELEDTLLDLAWGFIEAIYWYEDESVYDALERLNERSEVERKAAAEDHQLFEAYTQVSELARNEVYDCIEEILQEMGIEPTPGPITSMEIGDEVIESRPRLVEQIYHALLDGQSEIMLSQDSDGELSTEEAITPELVREVIKASRLVEKQQLRDTLRQDARRLKQKGGSPPAASVFMEVFESGEEANSSREIASELNENADWTSRVTMFSRDLAGIKQDNSGWEHRDLWDDRPLVQGDENEGWETTTYGEGLGYSYGGSETVGLASLSRLPKGLMELLLDEIGSSITIPD